MPEVVVAGIVNSMTEGTELEIEVTLLKQDGSTTTYSETTETTTGFGITDGLWAIQFDVSEAWIEEVEKAKITIRPKGKKKPSYTYRVHLRRNILHCFRHAWSMVSHCLKKLKRPLILSTDFVKKSAWGGTFIWELGRVIDPSISDAPTPNDQYVGD